MSSSWFVILNKRSAVKDLVDMKTVVTNMLRVREILRYVQNDKTIVTKILTASSNK